MDIAGPNHLHFRRISSASGKQGARSTSSSCPFAQFPRKTRVRARSRVKRAPKPRIKMAPPRHRATSGSSRATALLKIRDHYYNFALKETSRGDAREILLSNSIKQYAALDVGFRGIRCDEYLRA